MLAEITDDVSAGAPLSEAMGKHDRAFDPLYASMVRAGEAGGILDRVLDRLATFREKAATIRAKIKQAMLYPSALILFAIAAVVIVIVFVIPRFREIFDSYGVDLPRPTQILLALSDAGSKYWYLVIGIPAAPPGSLDRRAAEPGLPPLVARGPAQDPADRQHPQAGRSPPASRGRSAPSCRRVFRTSTPSGSAATRVRTRS